MSRLAAWLTVLVLACGPRSGAAAPAAAELQPLARSAQLTLEGSATATGVTLRVRPAIAGAPLTVTDLSISVDGKSARALRQTDGSWFAPLPGPLPAGGRLDIFVTHDGIRELLSAKAQGPAAATPGAGGSAAVLRTHKQLAWWILNIAIVLIAAIAISRRMS